MCGTMAMSHECHRAYLGPAARLAVDADLRAGLWALVALVAAAGPDWKRLAAMGVLTSLHADSG